MVEVLDAWNTEYNNIVDDDQDTFMYTSSVEDGRIICRYKAEVIRLCMHGQIKREPQVSRANETNTGPFCVNFCG